MLKCFTLEHSDDGAVWQPLAGLYNEPGAARRLRELAERGQTRLRLDKAGRIAYIDSPVLTRGFVRAVGPSGALHAHLYRPENVSLVAGGRNTVGRAIPGTWPDLDRAEG